MEMYFFDRTAVCRTLCLSYKVVYRQYVIFYFVRDV